MANELVTLKLTELSLVDRPANPLAMAPIFKRDESQGEDMTDKINEEFETLKSDFETLKAENERLRKSLIENDFVIKADAIEKKAAAEYIEVEGEQINKADVPAPILKRLEEAEAKEKASALAKMAGETLPNFKKEVAVELVKMELSEEVLEALKAADKLFEDLMVEKGESSAEADMTDPKEKLETLAKNYADENGVSIHKARVEVSQTAQGRELQKEIMKG